MGINENVIIRKELPQENLAAVFYKKLTKINLSGMLCWHKRIEDWYEKRIYFGYNSSCIVVYFVTGNKIGFEQNTDYGDAMYRKFHCFYFFAYIECFKEAVNDIKNVETCRLCMGM